MLKPLFKITFVTFIWRRYKHIIISTFLLFLFMWLVGKVHVDYLNYAELHGENQNLGWSFVAKWLALVGSVVLYLSYHIFRRPKSKKWDSKQTGKVASDNNAPDPFINLRHEDGLRSKGDMVIEKYLHKDSTQTKVD